MAFNVASLTAKLSADTTDMERGLKKTQDDLDKTADKARGAGGIIQSALGSAFSGLASVATFGAAGAVAGLAAIGAAGVAAWGDYDSALDTVMQKTGVTGAALDQMGESIRTLSGSSAGVGTDMAHIGEVMADLRVRTGATGETLDGLTGQLLRLQQVQGDTAVSAQNFGRLLGDWSVPAEQGAGLMDQLFVASQKFGVSTDSLASKLVQFGSPLRQMGFDLQTSIAMFGQFEQQGVNTELVLGSLRIAAGKFADAHIPLQQGLTDTIKRIQGMKDSSEALAAGMEIFGARAGPDMVAAIREGRFSLDEAVASLQNYDGAIQNASEGAMDFPDQWAMGMNQIKAALIPVGQALMDLGSAAMPLIQTGFNMATGALTSFASTLSGMAGQVAPFISAIQGVFNIVQNGGGFVGNFDAWASGLDAAFGSDTTNKIISFASTLAGLAGSVQTALGPVVSAVQTTLGSAFQGIGQIALSALAGLPALFQSLAGPAQSIASTIGGVLSSAFQTAGQVAHTVLAGLPALLQAVSGPVASIASTVGGLLAGAFQSAGSIIHSVLGILPGLVQVGMAVLTALASTVGSVVAGAFQLLAPIAQSVMAGIANIVQAVMPSVLVLAQSVGSLLVTAFNVLQQVALAVFHAIQPYIPSIQNAVASLSSWVGTVLAGAFQRAADFIQNNVVPALQQAGSWLAEHLPVAIQAAADFWTNVLQPALAVAWGYIQNNLIPLFNDLVGWLQTNIPAGLQALSDFWQQHGDQILSIAQTAWDLIKGAIDGVLNTITTLWQAFQLAREGDWRGFGEKLREIWDGAWEAIKNAITTVGPQIVTALVQLGTDAKNAFLEIDWVQLGSDVIRGIGRGVTSMGTWLADLAREAAKSMLDAAKGFLGIHSPSAVMADEVGAPMAEGIAAGFLNAMDGGAIVSVVAGIRALMEQVGQILSGVGDAVSTSDWEDLANPVARMADLFKSITEVGRSIMASDLASTWDAARGQVARFVQSARALMEQLAPLLHNVGQLSTSDWEDFVAPLKLMAEAMTQIAGIAHLFEGGNIPSLAGLGAGLTRLASEARQMLVQLDAVIGPIGPFLAEKLKNLGDAAAGAKAVAENALGLVKALQEALTVDWAAINFGDAGRMMHDLAMQVAWFAGKAEEAGLAIQKTDTSGLAVLKSAAENLIGIADGARSLVAKLLDALTVKWSAINFSAAGHLMADLARMVVFFTERALTYAAALRSLDTDALSVIKASAESLLGIVESTRALVARLAEALTFNWGGVQWSQAGRLLAEMTRLVTVLAQEALAYAGALRGLDLTGLAAIRDAAQGVRDAAEAAFGLVQFALESLKLDWSKISFQALRDGITRLLLAAQQIAGAARDVMAGWQGEAIPALGVLGGVLTDALSVVNDTFDAVDRLLGGQALPAGALATSYWDSTSPLQDALWGLVLAAQQIGQAAHDAMGSWTVSVPPGLANLKTVLSDSLGVFEDTYKVIDMVMGGANPAGFGAAFTPSAADRYNRSPIWQRISELLVYATSLADMIRLSIGTWNTEVPPGLATLKGVLSDSLGIIGDTYKMIDLVMGDSFGGVNAADFTPSATGPDYRSPIWRRLGQLLTYATSLADMIRLSIGTWNMEVPPGLSTLKGVLSASLGIVQDTFSLVDALMGEGAPNLSGPAFDAGENNLIAAGLRRVLLAAQSIAEAANTAMAEWDIEVKPSLTHLAQALKASLDAATAALDLDSLLGGKVAPTFDLGLLKARLAQALQAGKDLADQANTTLGTWDVVVKDSFKHLADVLKASLEAATTTLDLNALLGGKTPPALDVGLLTGLLATVLAGGKTLAEKANEVIGTWDIEVKPALTHLGQTLKSSLDVVGAVLDFSDLQTRLVNFRGLDMRVIGPKLDLLIASAIAVAQEFGRRALDAGIKEEWQKAGAALKALFGDAVDSLLKAVDLGDKLADPSTQIPSVGQIQAKLTATLDFLGAVVSQFAASATSLAGSGVDFSAVTTMANSAKAAFDVIMSAVDTISTLREKHIGMDDLDNIRQFLRQVFTVFNEFQGQAVGTETVTAALTTLLGGIQTMVSVSGTAAGTSWAERFAAAITANAGSIQGAIAGALGGEGGGTTVRAAGAGSGSGGASSTQITYNQQRYVTVHLTQVASESTLTQSAGSVSTLAALYGA